MLKKRITNFGVFSVASGAMISSGIFILPGMAYSIAGPAVFVSYFIAGVISFLGILSVVELATAMPKAGGDYFFTNKTFGSLLGTITGFLGWMALSLKSAFAIFGISEIIFIYTEIDHITSGLLICLVFVAINIIGIKEAVTFQIGLVVCLLVLLLTFLVFGLPRVDASRFSPFLTNGVNQIFVATGFVFITFGGLVKAATISEEVKDPKRNIPLGIISSVIIVTILYTTVTIVISGTLEAGELENSLTPVADAARLFMGTPGFVLVTIASLLAFISTANAGINYYPASSQA